MGWSKTGLCQSPQKNFQNHEILNSLKSAPSTSIATPPSMAAKVCFCLKVCDFGWSLEQRLRNADLLAGHRSNLDRRASPKRLRVRTVIISCICMRKNEVSALDRVSDRSSFYKLKHLQPRFRPPSSLPNVSSKFGDWFLDLRSCVMFLSRFWHLSRVFEQRLWLEGNSQCGNGWDWQFCLTIGPPRCKRKSVQALKQTC